MGARGRRGTRSSEGMAVSAAGGSTTEDHAGRRSPDDPSAYGCSPRSCAPLAPASSQSGLPCSSEQIQRASLP
jgi:hypothetical protein